MEAQEVGDSRPHEAGMEVETNQHGAAWCNDCPKGARGAPYEHIQEPRGAVRGKITTVLPYRDLAHRTAPQRPYYNHTTRYYNRNTHITIVLLQM